MRIRLDDITDHTEHCPRCGGTVYPHECIIATEYAVKPATTGGHVAVSDATGHEGSLSACDTG